MKIKGIDVSKWQGNIDWAKVKESGIEFALIRCGYGKNVESQDDAYFRRNAHECTRLGIPFGVYLYSYATNVGEASSEAEHVLRLIKEYDLAYGVWYDLEDSVQANLTEKELGDIAVTFCEAIEYAGHYCGIYANLSWFNTRLTDSRLNAYDKWVAQWADKCTYEKNFGLWQYTNQGFVPGIDGRIDMNIAYKDYPEIMSNRKHTQKSIDEIAREVVRGDWGNGDYRKTKLINKGYDYNAVQAKVNELLTGKHTQKSIDEIAREVVRGDWGNGNDRKNRLKKAGYDYTKIQKKVNELLY